MFLYLIFFVSSWQTLTCHWQNSEVAHPTDVLQPEVSDLRTPAQEERAEGQHGGDIAHPNVADVNTAVQGELLQVGEITSDVLEGSVSDPRAPGKVQTDQLPQVLSNQLNTVVSDLTAARQREDCQVWQRVNWNNMRSGWYAGWWIILVNWDYSLSLWFVRGQERTPLTYIDEAVVCNLPAGLKSQHVQSSRLFGREVRESGVCDVVGLQVELVQGGEELGDGTDALVSHVDAVCKGEADQPRVEAGPEALLRDLVTAVDLEGVERLQELHQSLQASVSEVTTPQTENNQSVSQSLSPLLLTWECGCAWHRGGNSE